MTRLLLHLCCIVLPVVALAQQPPGATTGTPSTLDMLLDLAASAPATGASSAAAEKGATDKEPKDSRERLLQQLKAGKPAPAASGPDAAALAAISQIPVVPPHQRHTAAAEEPLLVPQRDAPVGAAREDDRPRIARDSWLRTFVPWLRENRGWIVGIAAGTLALLWFGSYLFTRGARGASASAGGGSAPPPRRDGSAALTRPARRPHRDHRRG